MNRGVTIKTAQTPVQKSMPDLLERVEQGDIDRQVFALPIDRAKTSDG